MSSSTTTNYPATASATATATLTTALQSPMAATAPLAQLEYVLAQAMAKAFADMGQRADERQDEIAYLVKTMPAEVVRHLPGIKLHEIPLAIGKGILRTYGDFFGLNVATFMYFLTQHYQSQQRAEAVKKLQSPQGQDKPPPTEAELHQMRLEVSITAFARYKAEGHYYDYGNLVYNSLDILGKMTYTAAQKKQMMAQAHENLKRKYSIPSPFTDERAKLRQNLQSLLNGDSQGHIITEAKRIALYQLFDAMITQGMEMEELLGDSI